MPGFTPSALSAFGVAEGQTSPLVLDLDGDGVELTDHDGATTTTFFDIDADGFAEQTAWVEADDGLLAIDTNDNGVIDDASELFGTATIDGFAKLAELDSNGDLIFDANDAAWNDLLIWNDANQDAHSQSGELEALSAYNIVSIDLAGVSPFTQTISGNPISHESSFKYANGTTGDIMDAWLVHDNVNTQYVGDYSLSDRALSLPTLRGLGELPDLVISMSQDEDLLEMVEDFALNWTLASFADQPAIDSAIEDILFTWAWVDGIATDSRGPYIDARRLEFLEEWFDAEWQQDGYLPDPEVNAAAQLEVSWDIVFTAMKAALLLQSGADELFADALTYDAWSGEIVGDPELDEDAVGDLADVAPAPGTANEAFWMAVARFIDDVQGLGELTGTEEGWLDDAVQASDATLIWEDVLDLLEASEPPVNYDGTSGNDVMTGSAGANSMRGFEGDDEISGLGGDDTLDGGDGADELYGGDGDDLIYGGAANPVQNDILDGGHGNDTLHGHRGDDTLTGGTGGNFLYGGMGDDTYIYAGGSDVLAEEGSGGTDILELPDGIELADLDLYRIQTGSSTTTFNDLLIRIDGGGSIQIGQQFRTDTGYQVETLVFHDTSTLDLLDLDIDTLLTEGDDYLAVTLSTADADDVVYGLSVDDSIRTFSGNDILDGGTGNDILQGDDGHDTYIASPGYDKIGDGGTGTDTINIPVAYAASDLSFLRIPGASSSFNDGLILIEGLGQIELSLQFYASGTSPVEQIAFDNSDPSITLASQVFETRGTTGNDTICGITVNGSPRTFSKVLKAMTRSMA